MFFPRFNRKIGEKNKKNHEKSIFLTRFGFILSPQKNQLSTVVIMMTASTEIWKNTHDLQSLPEWGPYSKRFFGLSHIADPMHGHRFDFFAVPSLYRRNPCVPDALRSCGYLPWEASSDLKFYSYRHQLEWKDRVYADISFSAVDSYSRLFRCEFCNNTAMGLDIALHLFSMLVINPQEKIQAHFRKNGYWLNAMDYSQIHFDEPEFFKGLNPEGRRPGEEWSTGCAGGVCIGQGFGKFPGHRITWLLKHPMNHDELYIRCQIAGSLPVTINGHPVTLQGNGEWSTLYAGRFSGHELTLVTETGNPVQINGFGIGESPFFEELPLMLRPEVTAGPIGNSAVFRFPGMEKCYGLQWEGRASIQRQYAVGSLEKLFLYDSGIGDPSTSLYDIPTGNDLGYDIVLQPLPLSARSRREFFALAACGTEAEIQDILRNSPLEKGRALCRKIMQREQKKCSPMPETPYTFSQKRMQAVTLTNVVYPIRLYRKYVRHHTPGRCWDSLYTWDSGFIGLGLLEIEPARAAENLNAYTFPPKNRENAFVRHGTPLPMQIILYHELINRTGSREWMTYFYPRVRKMYDFLNGGVTDSKTRAFSKAGLISTWKYSYNSGGWDDYPAQKYIHVNQAHHILPVISTAIIILTGKLLSYWADELGRTDDAVFYRDNGAKLTEALQKYSWNPASGFFSYVVHDAKGNVKGRFLQEDGTDWNMGLDGLSPLIAGAVTPEQDRLLWKRVMSEKHFRTKTGISTVDLSAPYFRLDGYANGANWTAFEYFLWKSALDCGRLDDAWNLASSGLALWQRETENSYACFEHFSIRSERGNGWHHFSSFSTPYSIWFHAYFIPGRLTVGFDTQILSRKFMKKSLRATLRIHGKKGGKSGIVIVLEPGRYKAFWQKRPILLRQRQPGTFETTLPCQTKGTLLVVPD